ncbi:putative uncharacterized protein ENSP00000383309 [Zingiber officinale]|uniref:putative uncharacterized protein ENSP00000383309 n=1 Tax=Zingiber officinale TaxID=94328 RepID=UPI001C4CB7F3|nr:putative uncharacterized protein ENSP00000383309 [Zingiber officinale]
MAAAAGSSLAASSGRKSQTVEAWGTDGLSEGRSRRPRRRTRWNGCCPRLTSSFLLDARHRIIRDQIFWTTYPGLSLDHICYIRSLSRSYVVYDPSHVQNACTRPRTEALASPPLPQPPASPAASLQRHLPPATSRRHRLPPVASSVRPRPPSHDLQRPPPATSLPRPPATSHDLQRPPPATSLQRPPATSAASLLPRSPAAPSRDLPLAPSAASLLPTSPAAPSRDLPLATSSNLQRPPSLAPCGRKREPFRLLLLPFHQCN